MDFLVWKTHSLIDRILIDRRCYLSILYIWSFIGAICDIDHYLVVAEVMQIFLFSNVAAQKLDMEN